MTEVTTFDADDWRAKSPDSTGEVFRRNIAAVERLKGRGAGAGRRPAAAGRRVDARPSRCPGRHRGCPPARPAGRYRSAAAALELSADELRQIDEILADVAPLWGPHPEGM
jgi:hypothetical protein